MNKKINPGSPQITPYSVALGLVMTILFSAAAAYLGLKVGQVFEAFPLQSSPQASPEPSGAGIRSEKTL